MFNPALTHGHLTKSVNEYTGSTHYEFNNTPIVYSGFDGESFNDYHGAGLQFDWSHDIGYFFRNGLLKFGL